MIRGKELNELGLPNNKKLMGAALKLVNVALSSGADRQQIYSDIRSMCQKPDKFINHEFLESLARLILEDYPDGLHYVARKEPAPWLQWGDINLEPLAVKQMRDACSLPVAIKGALMPDAHAGYGLPIGGVLAVKDAVVPYAVGKDIACRMRLTILDLPLSDIEDRQKDLINALQNETSFGLGACFEKNRREHPVMDEDWSFSPFISNLYDRAAKQLGSSGGGNHFVEFGELNLEHDDLGLKAGSYLALLSHSGSRGVGEAVAEHYSKMAQQLRPNLSQELKNLAWLDLGDDSGREYWAAMELMGRYAAANHELIHKHVLQALNAEALAMVENHHNFAWLEEYDGEPMVIHRKGATPAGKGVLGVVPGSMGTDGFVVRGKGNEASLCSCSHGAGRLMSRTAAFKAFNRQDVKKYLDSRKVHLISGGLDEAPMAYKDIHQVMKAQSDLVDIVAKFTPRIVKMAPEEKWRSKRR